MFQIRLKFFLCIIIIIAALIIIVTVNIVADVCHFYSAKLVNFYGSVSLKEGSSLF